MFTADQVTAYLVAWLTGVVPALGERTYDYAPSGKPLGLPDASIILLTQSLALGNADDTPWAELQQVRVMVYEFGVSFMVDAGTDDDGERTADVALRGYGDALLGALAPDGAVLADKLLAAPAATMDFATPFAEYEDGTRGREATLTVSVTQLL